MERRTTRVLSGGALVVLAIGVLTVAGVGPASGEDAEVTRLRAAAGGESTDGSRAALLRDLVAMDTADSRRALAELADSKDAQVSTRALLAIGRADQDGGRTKLKAVFEDTKRPHPARVAAFLAYARLLKADGSSWSTIESYGNSHSEAGSQLRASVAAAKNALFPATTGEGR